MENINNKMMQNIAWERIAEAVIARDFGKLVKNFYWLNNLIKNEDKDLPVIKL